MSKTYLPAALAGALGISRSEARRAVEQGGVKVDGQVFKELDIDDADLPAAGVLIEYGRGRSMLLQPPGSPPLESLAPAEWMERKHPDMRIADPDGWRGPEGRPFEDPITEKEFDRRYGMCTIGPKLLRVSVPLTYAELLTLTDAIVFSLERSRQVHGPSVDELHRKLTDARKIIHE
jgi:hypothetical protein